MLIFGVNVDVVLYARHTLSIDVEVACQMLHASVCKKKVPLGADKCSINLQTMEQLVACIVRLTACERALSELSLWYVAPNAIDVREFSAMMLLTKAASAVDESMSALKSPKITLEL